MTTPAAIIQALTDRLAASGLPVYQGLVLDPQVDSTHPLPAVIVHLDGDTVTKTRPRLIRQMDVAVECWIRTTGQETALSEVLDYAESVRAIAAPFDSYDVPDTLNATASAVIFKTLKAKTRERQWAVAEIALTIQYGG